MSDKSDKYLCSRCGLSFRIAPMRRGNSYLCSEKECKVIYQEGWVKSVRKTVALYITKAVAKRLRNEV